MSLLDRSAGPGLLDSLVERRQESAQLIPVSTAASSRWPEMAAQPLAASAPHPIPEWLKGHSLTGPFISGTSHRVLVLGQNAAGTLRTPTWDCSCAPGAGSACRPPDRPAAACLPQITLPPNATTDFEDADARTPAARKSGLKTRSSGPAAASEASGSASRAWPVSLADLVGAGLLAPGPEALSVLYKGSTHSAALLPEGTIRYDGKVYGSASAFSIHVKRLITPDKQGDDGWKSVLYQGKPLDVYRCDGSGRGREPKGCDSRAPGVGGSRGERFMGTA